MFGNNEQIIQAYTETACLLKYFPNSYIEKLPDRLFELINKNFDRKYIIDIDPSKKISEHKICTQTKKILAFLNYSYWSTNEQKETLNSKLYMNEQLYRDKIAKQYDINNIFKNTEQIGKNNVALPQTVQLPKNNENFISKLFQFIIKKFKKK